MSPDPNPPPSYDLGRRAAPFRPRALMVLLYFAFVFIVIAMLLVLPEMMKVLETVPPGPEQQEITRQLVQESIGQRARIAFGLATLFTALGAYFKVLPGLR